MKGLFARARSLWRGLRRPDRLEAEMDEEMRFHMEMEAERLAREQGLEPREARRRAAVLFGGVDRYKEEGRDVRGITRLAGMSLDFRLGVRMLLRSPGLTAVAVLALSVAIGGGAAYLELVNDLVRPRLPFPDGGRVVGIYVRDAAKGKTEQRTAHDFLAWRGELESVRELGAFQPLERNLITPDGRTEPVEGVEISASAFRVTRVPPLLGRPLVEADEEPGAPPVAVLGHDLWRSRFGGDPGAVGRTVRLGSSPVTVVGVMPPGFAFPVNHGLWVPLRLDGSALRRGEGPAIRMFGRLAPGVGLGAAQAELGAAGLRAAAGSPDAKNLRPFVEPYVESLWSSAPDGVLQMRMMYALNLFFLGLLGVCGANVATLVFARTLTRAGEITVRTALGASRGRIAAQLFAEALVLTSVAAAVGLAAAALGLRWVRAALVAEGAVPPFWWDDRLAPATLLYAGVLAVLAAVVVGVVPALRATGPRLQAGLKHAAAGGSGTGFGGVWTGVIVTQVALTVVFLLVVVSVGWNVRVGRYGAPGLRFAAAEYLSVRLEMDRATPPGTPEEAAEAALRARFAATYRELARRLEGEPGVARVTYGSRLPGMHHPWMEVEVDGAAAAPGGGATHSVKSAAVDPGFFDAFGAPVLSGRAFDAGDVELGRDVVVVDQRFVQRVLGGRDPVGLRVREAAVERPEPGPWYRIVGVVRSLTAGGDESALGPVLYRPASPAGAYPLHLAVRVRGDAGSLAPRLRGIAAAVDPTLRLYDAMPMDRIGRADRMTLGFFLRVLGVVGVVALLLSTAGVYSLMSFTVTRRTREIGIRAAVGASPRRILTGVFSPAMAQVGLGVLAGSVPGSMVVAWGLPEVARGAGPALGFAAFAAIAAFMMGVGLLASAVPARRALRIQPVEALRAGG